MGETDVIKAFEELTPILDDGVYVFISIAGKKLGDPETLKLEPICQFSEKQGLSLVVLEEKAKENAFQPQSRFRMISFEMHTSISMVGLSAAVSKVMAEEGIACNVVSGFYSDHFFIDADRVDHAMNALAALKKHGKTTFMFKKQEPLTVFKNKGGKSVSGDATKIPNQELQNRKKPFESVKFDKEKYVEIMKALISQSKFVQNNPKLGLTPQESLICEIVLKELKPHSKEHGGPLLIEHIEYVPGRGNLKITLPSATYPEGKYMSFVGSHMDVVPANPEEWEIDPFTLTVKESDKDQKLYGRGTTDCLGHVGLFTRILTQICESKVKLKRNIVVIFIAAEEGGELGVGVDKLVECGKLEELRSGPVFWIDSADSQPCCGTAGALQWTLTATGRRFHSGLPHLAINPIELLSESLAAIQSRFFRDFPKTEGDEQLGFTCSSTMKPTQIECTKGSINQIPPQCTAQGDIRLSPFYDIEEAKAAVSRYVKEINDAIDNVPRRGPFSKYILDPSTNADCLRGTLELTWGEGDPRHTEGFFANLDSDGHRALIQATREVMGEAKPYSITGSLPIIRKMQNYGFDVQVDGFGLMSTYHANNEYCLLSHMERAHYVMMTLLALLNDGPDGGSGGYPQDNPQ